MLLRAHTCEGSRSKRPTAAVIHSVGRITCQLKACTKDQKGTWDWPTNCCCKHTHMCVRNSSRLHPRITCYMGLADQLAMSSRGCTQGPRVTRVGPTKFCCEHTHVCCKIKSIQRCTQGRHVTSVRQTRCCCEPTHMHCRIFLFNIAARVKRSFAAVSTHTHMCVSEQVNSSLHTKIKRYKGLANQVLLLRMSCCRMSQ